MPKIKRKFGSVRSRPISACRKRRKMEKVISDKRVVVVIFVWPSVLITEFFFQDKRKPLEHSKKSYEEDAMLLLFLAQVWCTILILKMCIGMKDMIR